MSYEKQVNYHIYSNYYTPTLLYINLKNSAELVRRQIFAIIM